MDKKQTFNANDERYRDCKIPMKWQKFYRIVAILNWSCVFWFRKFHKGLKSVSCYLLNIIQRKTSLLLSTLPTSHHYSAYTQPPLSTSSAVICRYIPWYEREREREMLKIPIFIHKAVDAFIQLQFKFKYLSCLMRISV